MSEKPLKSAYELAMERLRAKDRAEGVEESEPLNERKKEQIARLRREAQAKLAELEILQRKAVAEAAGDPDKLSQLEQRQRIDRQRIESRLETAIVKVRRGED